MGIIYFIQCLETNEIYIGSTKRTLKDRIWEHNSISNKCYSKQIIDRGNYIYDVLEEVEDNKSKEREQYYITTTDNCINKITQLIDYDKKKYMKEYYHLNKDKQLSKNKILYKCSCGNTITMNSLARHMKTKKHLLGIHNREESSF